MKTKKEPNELKMPVELSDDVLDNVIGGLEFNASGKPIMKEMDKSLAQVEDNAFTTFSGKILSD